MSYVIEIMGPLLEGTGVTLQVFLISFVLAVPLGLGLALSGFRVSPSLSGLVNGYIWLMRGTPLMLQMLFIYFALPFVPVIGVRLPDFPAAIVAFVLNYAAYFAEIFRAGIQSIDRGQYEGARVLGLSYAQTMRRIVLPQVFKRILPPMSNETITLVKDTSLIYVLAMNDLLRAARGIVQRDFTTTPFVVAAAFYLLMTLVLTLASSTWKESTRSTMASPMIHARDVHKRFAAVEVLRGVSLAVDKGEVVAIIGPSGSGKSTFLRCLNHLETINRGRIDIAGETLVCQHDRRRLPLCAGRRHPAHLSPDGNGLPALQPVSAPDGAAERHRGADHRQGPAARRDRPASPRNCCARSACSTSRRAIRRGFPAARSSASPLPARWRWSRTSCSSTSRPRRSTRNSPAKCCAPSANWPKNT
jgi:polar amino acid transport system permease protein